jgi:hypothetical protein
MLPRPAFGLELNLLAESRLLLGVAAFVQGCTYVAVGRMPESD